MKFCPIRGCLFLGFAFTGTLLGIEGPNIALAQSGAAALEPAGAKDSEADRYFFEAKAKATKKQWVEALALFERAWELKPSHDIAGNLGQVALKLGRYKKAATFLDRCLRLFPPTGSPEQRAQIQTLFETARAHVAQVRILVTPQRGELVIDRVTVLGAVAPPSEPVFVDPGMHILQIRQGDQIVGESSFAALADAVHDVKIAAADERSRHSQSVSESKTSSAGHTERSDSRAPPPNTHGGWLGGRSGWPVLIGASTSVAAVVSAGLLISAANGEVGTAKHLISSIGAGTCGAGTHNPVECQSLRDANQRADTRYNWGYAMLGVGGVSLLATLGYVLWPSSAKPTSGLLSVEHACVGLGIQRDGGRVEWTGQF